MVGGRETLGHVATVADLRSRSRRLQTSRPADVPRARETAVLVLVWSRSGNPGARSSLSFARSDCRFVNAIVPPNPAGGLAGDLASGRAASVLWRTAGPVAGLPTFANTPLVEVGRGDNVGWSWNDPARVSSGGRFSPSRGQCFVGTDSGRARRRLAGCMTTEPTSGGLRFHPQALAALAAWRRVRQIQRGGGDLVRVISAELDRHRSRLHQVGVPGRFSPIVRAHHTLVTVDNRYRSRVRGVPLPHRPENSERGSTDSQVRAGELIVLRHELEPGAPGRPGRFPRSATTSGLG